MHRTIADVITDKKLPQKYTAGGFQDYKNIKYREQEVRAIKYLVNCVEYNVLKEKMNQLKNSNEKAKISRFLHAINNINPHQQVAIIGSPEESILLFLIQRHGYNSLRYKIRKIYKKQN